jgi:hypothetical protein
VEKDNLIKKGLLKIKMNPQYHRSLESNDINIQLGENQL